MNRWIAGVAVGVLVACSGGEATHNKDDSVGGAGKAAPPLSVPPGVPADATVVAVVRSPWTLGEGLTRSFWGAMDPAIAQELRADIKKLLTERLGIDPLNVETVAGFLMDGGGGPVMALIAPGVGGELRGKPVGEHAGVELFDLDGDTVALAKGSLYLGHPIAVRAALDAVGGTDALAADSTLGKLLTDGSAGAFVAVAADPAGIPDTGIQQGMAQFGVTGAAVHVGSMGIRARVVASESGAKQLEDMLRGGLAMASAQIDAQLAAARSNPDGFEAVGVIFGAHHARNAIKQVVIDADGGILAVRLPIESADATVVVAVVGVLSAVAIPAFMKYIKKSKTTEARHFVKKMHDGARAHYLDQGSLPPSAPLTPSNPTACCEKCAPDARLWTNESWIKLLFSVDDPHYYAYEFVSDGRSQFTARAYGDLDCDGDLSTFEMYGTVGPDGIAADPGIYRSNELE